MSLAQYRVGIDGGQSQVRLRLVGAEATHAADGVTHFEGDTATQMLDTLRVLWAEAVEPGSGRIECIALGLTTQPSDPSERFALAALIGTGLDARTVRLTSDATIAHLAALPSGHGVSLVVGTGIACLAVDAPSGISRLVDGDGFLLGDRGGAFWIGRRGLGAVLAAGDGRGPATSLSAAAAEWFGVRGNLAGHIHGLGRPVNAIAQFAAAVQTEASAGDDVASGIMGTAARHLADSCAAGAQIVTGDRVAVAVTGRAAASGTPLLAALRVAMAEHPRLELVEAAGVPLDGAVALAQGDVPTAYANLVTEWRAEP